MEVRPTVKARIETIRVSNTGEAFSIQVVFPAFTGPSGDALSYTFETTIQEYQDWQPPSGVTKTPSSFIEYKYVRPAYTRLVTIHGVLMNLADKEFDW